MEYALEISNLVKNYSDFLLDNVNLKLPKGSIMGFIGENGAGKSTTIKAILNIIKKDSGEIRILGMNASDPENEIQTKQQVGVVFDENHFHDLLNAKGVNRFMNKIYPNWNQELFFQYIKKFQIPENKFIKEFSRGMKMKFNISVALAHEPKLLLLDEATSGLDPVVRNEILDVFLDFIQDEEHSILISSHITSDLERICDYITFVHEGKIILSKTKDELLENFHILHCSKESLTELDSSIIRGIHENRFACDVLIELEPNMLEQYKNYIIDRVSLEDIMLYYGKEQLL